MPQLMAVLLSLTLGLVVVGGSVWGLYRLGHWVNQVPAQLRGHLFAAIVWTLITLCQTIILLNYRETQNIVGHLVVFIAGWVMISSWAQFAERRRGESYRQDRRWLLHRLPVQTVWGPLAVWLGVGLFCHYSQLAFSNALARRDVSTLLLLKQYGLGQFTIYEEGPLLVEAVKRSDPNDVTIYLTAGANSSWLFQMHSSYTDKYDSEGASASKRNLVITRLLLKCGASPEGISYGGSDYPLHHAVSRGDIRQVQILLQHGAKRKVYNSAGKTPFQLAKEHKDAEMVALLSTYPAK